MLRNQNPRGSTCSGIQTEIPLWGVNIRRNVSRMKRLKALFETENPPDLGGQYAPEYPTLDHVVLLFRNQDDVFKVFCISSHRSLQQSSGFLRKSRR